MRSSAVTWKNNWMTFLLAGDFNQTDLRSVLPQFHQHVHTPTRGNNTLDCVYTNSPDSYKALPHPHFGQSDHISLLLLPTYTQLIKSVKPSETTIKVWTDEATAALQDCFKCTDWQMFRDDATQENHNNFEEYTYISKCVDDVAITKAAHLFSNQKAWVNGDFRSLSRAKKAAFRSGDKKAYNTVRARQKTGIKEAKQRHQERLETSTPTTPKIQMGDKLKEKPT